jgi:hypothetical protein
VPDFTYFIDIHEVSVKSPELLLPYFSAKFHHVLGTITQELHGVFGISPMVNMLKNTVVSRLAMFDFLELTPQKYELFCD